MDKIFYILAVCIITAQSFMLYYKSSEISDLKDQIIAAQAEASKKSLQLQEKITNLEDQNNADKKAHEKIVNNLRRRIANGLQLSADNTNSSDSTAKDSKTACRLSREIAGDLISIAERGDRAIIDLNQCIDSYNALRLMYENK